MPTEFKVYPQWNLVVSRGSGVFTYSDFLEHMSRMRVDPEFKPDLNQVVDCRAFTKLDLSQKQIMDLASQSIFDASSRRAFVVSSDVQFGLARMFATYREIKAGQEVMVFEDLPNALSWLGLPTDLKFATT